MQAKIIFKIHIIQICVGSNNLYFIYDAVGNPEAALYNGTLYNYVTNLQGDVIKIQDDNNADVVAYTYDAWGRLLTTTGTLASTLGTHNPLRYRGYVYDHETGLYYLQSRYYNPTIGRFINADAFAATGQGMLGSNMFVYCGNNPINFFDSCGHIPMPAQTRSVSLEKSNGDWGPIDQYNELKESFSKIGITLYYSIEGALSAWRAKYLPLSEEYEYVTFLYKVNTPLGDRYFTSQTYKGAKEGLIMSANVIGGTLALAVQDTIYSVELIAHVHTHPNPPPGYHNDFPSASNDIYGGDRMVFELLNFSEMFIIPYKRCSGTPQVIVYTDRSTWCSHCPY